MNTTVREVTSTSVSIKSKFILRKLKSSCTGYFATAKTIRWANLLSRDRTNGCQRSI